MNEELIREWPDCEQFYNLMQVYRHSPLTDTSGTVAAYEAVMAWLRAALAAPSAQADTNTIEFLHKRRGELVIERDRYKAALGQYPEGRDVMLAGLLAQHEMDTRRIAELERAAPSAQVPREPTEAMQRAMVDAMFDEGGDLKWRELAKIARKGWRAAYDTAMPAKVDGGAKERLGLWQVQGYTATDAAQPPSAPSAQVPREPTEAMIEAADKLSGDVQFYNALWRAMYDAAQLPSAPAEGKP